MKKIDKYLLFSFLPPFVVTFFIALFVLIMQFLWVYIDDIIGKGVGVFLIIELIFYLSISLFPMALPIAVLISTVMVTGNLAEHYELSSFKSAGVPLLRVMRPLMVACGLVAVFSFFCANNLIPIANLKFKSRLYDIRKQKPTLSLDGGVFNYDFQGSVIHIGKKRNDERTIEQVKIYDHENSTQGVSSQITAQTGEMYTTGDDRYFVMNLYGGTQYQEPTRDSKNKERKPFIRTSFKEFNKVYDLSEFQLSRTNEELFKQHETMLSIPQLAASIDSIDIKTRERKDNLVHQFNRHFLPWKTPEVEEEEDRQAEKQAQKQTEFMDKYKDKLPPRDIKVKAPAADSSKVMAKPIKKTNIRPTLDTQVPEGAIAAREKANSEKSKQTKRSPIKRKKPANQISLDRLDTLSSFTQTINTHQRKGLYTRTLAHARSINSQLFSTVRFLNKEKESRVKRVYELWSKFSFSLVCFIFLFIGAPMGAIVRKGGFGYPILVAILFFMLFIILTIACKKLAINLTLPPILAAWMPCIVLFPIGLILTYKAMNDSKMINVDRYLRFFNRLLRLAGGV